MTATDEPRTGVSAATATAEVPTASRGLRASLFLERFNRPITIVAAILILIFDRVIAPSMMMGPAYVSVVLLSLWAPRTRDTYLAATLCTVFQVFDMAMTDPPRAFGLYIANRTLAIGVIWVTAAMCLWRKRQHQYDGRVLAQAERALLESREVLSALDRAEKAEEAHRQAEARLSSNARSACASTRPSY